MDQLFKNRWTAVSRPPDTTEVRALLHKRSTLKDGQCLLQSCNLSFPALLALLIRFWLGNALLLDFLIILKHSIELCVLAFSVRGKFCKVLVKALELFRLVLHILLLGCLSDLVLLRQLVILSLCSLLFGLLLCQVLGEVRLDYLEHGDDATASTSGRLVHLRNGRLLHKGCLFLP